MSVGQAPCCNRTSIKTDLWLKRRIGKSSASFCYLHRIVPSRHSSVRSSVFSIHRVVTGISAILAAVLLIVCIPLMTQTMRTDGINCGTVFASSDSWTYASTTNEPSSYYRGATSQADLKAGAKAAVNDLMSDLSRGAAAYEYCEIKHSDRRMLLISLGSVTVLLLAVAGGSWWLGRRQTSENLHPSPSK